MDAEMMNPFHEPTLSQRLDAYDKRNKKKVSSPRFTEVEREAMEAVLRLAQEQMYKAEATSVKGNSPNNLHWSEIYKEYLSHMSTVRKMLEGPV